MHLFVLVICNAIPSHKLQLIPYVPACWRVVVLMKRHLFGLINELVNTIVFAGRADVQQRRLNGRAECNFFDLCMPSQAVGFLVGA